MADVPTYPQCQPNRARTSEDGVSDGVVPDSSSLVAGYLEFSDSDSDDYCTDDERVKIKKKAVRGKVVGGEKTVTQ